MNPLHFLLGLVKHSPAAMVARGLQDTFNPQHASGNLQGSGAVQGQLQVAQAQPRGYMIAPDGSIPLTGPMQGQTGNPQQQGDYGYGAGYLQGSPRNPQITQFSPYIQSGSLPTNQGRFAEDVGLEGNYLQGNNPYRYRGL